MNEGQELLLKVIDFQLKKLKEIDKDSIMCNGTNLVTLVKSIDENHDNFANVTDEVIDYIIENSTIKNASSYKNKSLKIRDLLIGKRDYKLKVELNNEYISIIKITVKSLNKILNDRIPGIINVEELENRVKSLFTNIQNREIINDFDLIEEIVNHYNESSFDSNMVKVMKFVNEHNLGILKTPKKNAPLFDIQFIRRPKLDERIIEILEKLEINYKELPNYLISELKKCNVEDVYNTYNIVRRNKAEEGGILHLIKKENALARLIIILYASETSIKSVLNSIKTPQRDVDINILKILLNNIITCFLSKNNEYFKPKYEDFIKNMSLLKELSINYKSLINKTPLFLITDNEVLEYTLKYLENLGANKKLIINRCYKTLAIKPSLLIENVDILKKYKINLDSFFDETNKNYNLLKTINLEAKIVNILSENKNLNSDNLDHELVNKYIVSKIYREVTLESEVQDD